MKKRIMMAKQTIEKAMKGIDKRAALQKALDDSIRNALDDQVEILKKAIALLDEAATLADKGKVKKK